MTDTEREPLFHIEGDACAVELGPGRTTTLCPRCDSGTTVQTGELEVELSCEPRDVWLSSRNALLVKKELALEIEQDGHWLVRSIPVQARWRDGTPWSEERLPVLRQLVAEQPISASPASVEFNDCVCGAVRRISFQPLIVQPPNLTDAGIWFLKENPAVLLIGERLRVLLSRHDAAPEFSRAYYEGEEGSSFETIKGLNWGDLG